MEVMAQFVHNNELEEEREELKGEREEETRMDIQSGPTFPSPQYSSGK